MIPITVATYKTKKGALNFINRHPELNTSDTVTIIKRNEARYDVVEFMKLGL